MRLHFVHKFVLFLSLFLIFLLSPKSLSAYQQTEAVCYSQCAAYQFGWKGDFCWDLFTNQCSISSSSAVSKMIIMVKNTVKAMAEGKLKTIADVSVVFKAMFMCKPLIDECITPQLDACENVCKNDSQTMYAPNLSAGNPYGSVAFHNVYYDEDNHQLVFKVVNNGFGYAWDIDVTASWGHTCDRDKIVSGGGTLFTEKIPELLFVGARIGSPKDYGDIIKDFLIDESNISNFLGGFKSDADNHYVPPAWYKTVPFTAPENEYTKVILNVDPNQIIPESNEFDNTYILEINKLPSPAHFTIENLYYRRTQPNNLTEYMVGFQLKNSGQESGKAYVKWYEGDYEQNKSPLKQQEMVIQSNNQAAFDQILTIDVTNGGNSCNLSQKFTIVVFDDEGYVLTQQEFYLPQFAGSIYGRVVDLFGKKVVGATITSSTGQTAETNEMGFYCLNGISTLGKVTLTASHPDFSQDTSQEVEISFDDSKDKCYIDGLTHDGVDFILKDQEVTFTVSIKDVGGNPVTAQVLITNSSWRFNETINGSGPLPGMQPGEYFITITAGGYKTIGQTVNAVPNQQNLEFILEPLNGRPTDDGLTIFANSQLLWQKDLDKEIFVQMTATKDGKEVVFYTTKNKENSGKLYFIDSLTGNEIKTVASTISTKGQSQSCLDTSYDGNTTTLYVHTGSFGIAQDTRNVLKLFDSQGNEIGTTDFKSGGGAHDCDVSPDGFYLFPDRLMNKGLYVYTRHDIEGIKSDEIKGYSGTIHFMTDNSLVAACPKDGGLCKQSIYENVLTNYGQYTSAYQTADSDQNAQNLAILTVDKAYYFIAGNKAWEKDIEMSGDDLSVSVSPGGKYVIYSTRPPQEHNRIFKIITDNNIDKTSTAPNNNEDVVFVHANDKGLFYSTKHNKTLKYYQIGSYLTDYTTSPVPSANPESQTNALSYWSDGNWYPSRTDQSFNSLVEGAIYIANRNITLDMGGSNGSLFILKDTIFSVDAAQHPILLKGQLTADFGSPMTIYALKFDRFDMTLFQSQVDSFRSNRLDPDQYFIIQNIHTKFSVLNAEGKTTVAVANGEINVKSSKLERNITAGKKITINNQNQIQESIYFEINYYLIIIIVLIAVSIIFWFINRKNHGRKKCRPN